MKVGTDTVKTSVISSDSVPAFSQCCCCSEAGGGTGGGNRCGG